MHGYRCPFHRLAIVAALIGFAGCRDLPPAPAPPDPPDPKGGLVLDELRPLHFDTYDGSGQVVHPDVPSGIVAAREPERLLVLTPYPYGDSYWENPSIFGSPDPLAWVPLRGVQNPIARAVSGYLSDPDVVYDPAADRYDLYYRRVGKENEILLTRSSDGVSWTAPVRVAHAPNHDIVSPAVVRRAEGEWYMWSVRSGVGCAGAATTVERRRSPDGVSWSAPEVVTLQQPGYSVWHLDVRWIPSLGAYWALYNVKTPGTCATPAVFLATSDDGLHWTTFPSPVLSRGASRAFDDIVYRSTFSYDPATDVVTFWYSGARYAGGRYVWSAAVQRRARAALITSLALAPPPSGGKQDRERPPLLDAP